ncbi:MAG: hypothetical protein IPN17_10760 [Deltaproteobacteria bacterium]|nr:hypothetical protein [Deltaproteobacteria bacterium]
MAHWSPGGDHGEGAAGRGRPRAGLPFVLAFNFAVGFAYVAAGAATPGRASVGGPAGARARVGSTLLKLSRRSVAP